VLGFNVLTGGAGFVGVAAGFAGGETSFVFAPIQAFRATRAPARTPAPPANPAGVVADLLSGTGFALGLVHARNRPVVVGVFGLPAASVPDAGPAGDVIVVVGVVADLLSGVSLAPGWSRPEPDRRTRHAALARLVTLAV